MYPRTEYEMTEADLQALLDAMRPTPVMLIGGVAPPSQQENANSAWRRLGEAMGFDYMTVRPIDGKGRRFFSAVPSESAEARSERIAREDRQRKLDRIKSLEAGIATSLAEIEGLRAELRSTIQGGPPHG